jgi:hypothetical protein
MIISEDHIYNGAYACWVLYFYESYTEDEMFKYCLVSADGILQSYNDGIFVV